MEKNIKEYNRVNYLLNLSQNNYNEFEKLPRDLKLVLKPYLNIIKKGQKLTLLDYKKIKKEVNDLF